MVPKTERAPNLDAKDRSQQLRLLDLCGCNSIPLRAGVVFGPAGDGHTAPNWSANHFMGGAVPPVCPLRGMCASESKELSAIFRVLV
jgi:hypothetical protein